MKEKTEKTILWLLGGLLLAFGGLVVMVNLIGVGEVKPEKRVRMDLNTLTSALGCYKMDAGVFPTTEQGYKALVYKPDAEPVPERWKASMKKVITDRWKREYQYRQPGFHNPDSFDLWSLGQDGVPSDDDIGNWEQ